MFDGRFGLPVDKIGDEPEDELVDEPDAELDAVLEDKPDAEPDTEPDDEPAGAEPEEGDISACRMLQPAAMVMMVSELISVKRVLFFIFLPPYRMCLRLSCFYLCGQRASFSFSPFFPQKNSRGFIYRKKISEKNIFDGRMRYNENCSNTVKPPHLFCGDTDKGTNIDGRRRNCCPVLEKR